MLVYVCACLLSHVDYDLWQKYSIVLCATRLSLYSSKRRQPHGNLHTQFYKIHAPRNATQDAHKSSIGIVLSAAFKVVVLAAVADGSNSRHICAVL